MKILIIGNGGREHALLHRLRADAPDAEFHITRGNGGTGSIARPLPLDPTDVPALAAWAEQNAIGLAICGPEAPLAEGIAEQFARHGVPLFGPTMSAARIEASKSYAKRLMRDAGVATAAFGTFRDYDEAAAFIRGQGAPIVVKASGLAAGKGAVVCETVDDALSTARAMLEDHRFGEAGTEIVIEECLTGEELSIFALTDGRNAVTMLPAQDHKRIGEGDTGPNTGGMGAYAPVSRVTGPLIEHVHEHILMPTLDALRADGSEYRGLLYAGIMLTSDGPKVIEFNARFGDPETQVVLPLLRSELLEPMHAIARGGSIDGLTLDWYEAAALTTVLVAEGYPGKVESGKPIDIPASASEAEGVTIFHAGTAMKDGRLVTAGGRVLNVTAVGPDLATAAARSRAAAEAITFEGRQFRRDIGWRELERQAIRPH